jgi:hypothetical protein
MGALQCRNNPLHLREQLEGIGRFPVGGGDKMNPALVTEETQLWSHSWIVQAGRDGMGMADLPQVVLQEVALAPVQHSNLAAKDGCRVTTAL